MAVRQEEEDIDSDATISESEAPAPQRPSPSASKPKPAKAAKTSDPSPVRPSNPTRDKKRSPQGGTDPPAKRSKLEGSSGASAKAPPSASTPPPKDKYPYGAFLEGRILRTVVPTDVDSRESIFTDLLATGDLKQLCSYAYFIAYDEFRYHLRHVLASSAKVHLATDRTMCKYFSAVEVENDPYDVARGRKAGQILTQEWGRKVHFLEYQAGARLIITSANSMDVDLVHGDNHFYVQDFPRRTTAVKAGAAGQDVFEEQLLHHLDLCGVFLEYLGKIRGAFDYSNAKGELIASVPSRSEDDKSKEKSFGMLRLREVAAEFLGKPLEKAYIEVNTASIGSCAGAWLHSMASVLNGGRAADYEYIIVHPTQADNDDRKGTDIFHRLGAWQAKQIAGGALYGTITKTEGQSKEGGVTRDVCFRYRPKKRGTAYHSKTIAVFDVNPRNATRAFPKLFVLGSHNFSVGAWGKAIDKGAATCMNNLELSIAFKGDDLPALLQPGANFDDLMAFERPPQPYGPKDYPFTGWKKSPPAGAVSRFAMLPKYEEDEK